MDRIKLLIIIVDREAVDRICESVSAKGASCAQICYGKGTAKNSWLNVLGIGETEKGILFASVTESKIRDIYAVLENDYGFGKPNRGVAFTVPLAAAGGPATLKILLG
jgi:hypothetical protein